MSEWECVECNDNIWVCQEVEARFDDPDCTDLPPGNTRNLKSKKPCPGGWCEVSCKPYALAVYTIWFNPKSDVRGECNAMLLPEGAKPSGPGVWTPLGTRQFGPGWLKLFCKRGGKGSGGGADTPFKVAVQAVLGC